MKIIISGGGTGGHIFPAIAIANEIKNIRPDAEILFVGALGRMEMEKVPQNGYKIIGLPVAGFQRSFSLDSIKKNLLFPFKLVQSLLRANKIIKEFNPNVVIGTGGYASGPVLKAAQKAGIPTLIQEQNSYAGVTNKLLAKKAAKICVAYEGMEKYFPAEKLLYTGNPVRKDIQDAELLKLPGCTHFKLYPDVKTILVIGGSLGARTINKAIENGLQKLADAGLQLIWQTGKNYTVTSPAAQNKLFRIQPFIYEMHWAYGCADVVISRAGALSISELCLVGKPAILVPSPNVAEDHQTQNAMALGKKDAAIVVADADAESKLVDTVLALVNDSEKIAAFRANIKALGKPQAAKTIAEEVMKLV